MAKVSTLTFGDQPSNQLNMQSIELPMPMNPFEEHPKITQQKQAAEQQKTYKNFGDKLFKFFVTEQAKNEVNNLFTQARVTL